MMIRCSCMDRDGNQHEKVFTRDSQPLKFTLHATIVDGELQGDLYDAIEEHGGTVLDTDDGTDYVIFIPNEELSLEGYQKYYNTSRNADKRRIQVREIKLIEDSLMAGVFVDASRTRNRGGFPKGKKRNEFTWEDDENLSEFLAVTCPDGGRLGHKLYRDLVESYRYGDDRLWVLNHPASAWRERYKRNRRRFDERIDELKIELGIQGDWDDGEQPSQDDDIPRTGGSDGSRRTEKRRQREDNDDSDHDSLFSEAGGGGGGGGGGDTHAPEPEDIPHTQNDQQTTQEEEDEVHDALQQVSHFTEQPVASSRIHLSPEAPLGDNEEAGESISARRRNFNPTQTTTKRWPPARRHVATAPAIRAPTSSQRNANPQMTGARTVADLHVGSDSEDAMQEPKHADRHMVEEEAFDEGPDDGDPLGPIASPPAPIGADEEQQEQDAFEKFSHVKPLLHEFEWVPPPPLTSLHQSSQVRRRPLANVQPAQSPPVDQPDVISETGQASPPPSGLPTVHRHRKGSRPSTDAPVRVTRSRSKAADSPLQRAAREEPSTKEEPQRRRRGRPPKARPVEEEHKVQLSEPAVKEHVALMQVDETENEEDVGRQELPLEEDDNQMLRQLGITHPEPVRRGKRVASPAHVPAVSTPRFTGSQRSSSSIETFPMDGTRASAIKRKHEQEERHTPYKPPSGTRAAVIAGTQWDSPLATKAAVLAETQRREVMRV
ncbi:hypothetical protein Moror_2716 [Moniliophthora roreri MCA 2997]|uniref:BRCT domain-containing protein n=1 Tax=Moniliophthora roreri (strain MCA 2997) TaxID=1381753 RepID=V2WX29_MONRO|nr:hypothetical protein Moror_2716 [Moniliophthora roreri MCA 2997]